MTVVRGYRKEAVALPGVRTVDNDAFATTGEATSLARAAGRLIGDSVVVYGDVLFRRTILDGMMAVPGDIVLAVDAGASRPGADPRDRIQAERPYSPADLDDHPPALLGIGHGAHGEWIGLLRATPRGSALIRAELDAMDADGTLDGADMPALIDRIAARHPVSVHYVTGQWLDVDSLLDLADARNFP